MRILVTGGTGFIGRALVHALEARGDEPWVVSRRSAGRDPRVVGWDAIETQVKQADAIVNLAGEGIADARWTAERVERIRSSRVEVTASIADAVARAGTKPRVFISASAIGIYGLRGGEERAADESSPPGDDLLARLCVDWEGAADAARSAGVRVVHPRIGVVLGRGGGMLGKMVPFFRAGVGGPLGSGQQWVSWVHQADVVRALIFALDRDSVAGAVNVVAPSPVSMDAFARTLARVLRRPALLRVPAFAIRALFGGDLAEVLLTGPRALPERLAGSGFAFEFGALDAALADLVG